MKNMKYIFPALLMAASAQANWRGWVPTRASVAKHMPTRASLAERARRAAEAIPFTTRIQHEDAVTRVGEEAGESYQGTRGTVRHNLLTGRRFFTPAKENADILADDDNVTRKHIGAGDSQAMYLYLGDGESDDQPHYLLVEGDFVDYRPWTKKSTAIAGASVAGVLAGIVGLWNHYASVRAAKYEEEAAEYGLDEDAAVLEWELASGDQS